MIDHRHSLPSEPLRLGFLFCWTDDLIGRSGELGLEAVQVGPDEVPSPALDGCVLGWRADSANVARRFRRDGYTAPLIAALARPRPEDVVAALGAGCDDTQPFPCSPRELSARVSAIQRRIAVLDCQPDVIRVGRLEIGVGGSDPRLDGKPLKVSPNCAKVLATVAGSSVPVRAERIAAALYGSEPPPSNTVGAYLSMLRTVMATASGTDGWLALTDGGYVLFDAQRSGG